MSCLPQFAFSIFVPQWPIAVAGVSSKDGADPGRSLITGCEQGCDRTSSM